MPDSMPIDPIHPSTSALPTRKAKGLSDGPSFAELLKSSIQEVNSLQKAADAAISDLAQGKSESVTEVLTAVEKADLAFRALMQIRNKLVAAYEEINRLRI